LVPRFLRIDLSNFTEIVVNKKLLQLTQIKKEIVNSIVHGYGIIFNIVSIPIFIAFALKVAISEVLLVQQNMDFVFYNYLLFPLSTAGFKTAQ
jgi:hemolysin III